MIAGVSVPSLLGGGMEHDPGYGVCLYAQRFSALFIGRGDGTMTKTISPLLAVQVSVPSLLGGGMERGRRKVPVIAYQGFSALFIGRGDGTLLI